MEHTCVICNGIDVHSFQLRSDYGSMDALNHNDDFGRDDKPYYISGYYCRDCDSSTLLKKEDLDEHGKT